MVLNLRPRDSISDNLRQLHRLPIESSIQFKLCLLMHLIHTGRCQLYISETVQLVSDQASRSASTPRYILPRLQTVFGSAPYRSVVHRPQSLECASGLVSTDSIKKQLKIFLLYHSVQSPFCFIICV